MVFRNRDRFLVERYDDGRVSESRLEDILETADSLREPARTPLGYMGDIVGMAHLEGLDDDYTMFGGYAVLSHLVDEYGEGIVKMWRGSEDLDMVGTTQLADAINSWYDVREDNWSENVANKRTIKMLVPDGSEPLVKIDYVVGTANAEKTESIDVLGIPTNVFTPQSLLSSKLHMYDKEAKHKDDLYSLIGICERRGLAPDEVTEDFGSPQYSMLNRFLAGYKNETGRLSKDPSPGYVADLKRYSKPLGLSQD
jgi:hypothetical protein